MHLSTICFYLLKLQRELEGDKQDFLNVMNSCCILEWMKMIDFFIHVENIIKKTLYNVGQKCWKILHDMAKCNLIIN
jgi:hypothetical protein